MRSREAPRLRFTYPLGTFAVSPVSQNRLRVEVLNTAVIGLGRIGWLFHLPAIVRHPGFTLAAAVDPLEARRREAEQAYGVVTYQSVNALLASSHPDLVVVASPTGFHKEHTVQSLRAGCNVFCDKPIATSVAETDVMIAESERTGKKLMVYQPHRVVSEILALQAILDRDLLGTVYMIKRGWSGYDRRNDWQALRVNGGGMLNNYGAHMLDQMLYLTRSTAQRVSCVLRSVITAGDADDVVKILLETRSGIVCDLDINMAAAQPFPQWQVLGSHGSATLDASNTMWNLRYRTGEPGAVLNTGLAAEQRKYGSGEEIEWKEQSVFLTDFPPLDFYDKCFDYFSSDKPPFVPVHETREVMRCIEECRARADSRQE
jgi:predicted dehydrogenase